MSTGRISDVHDQEQKSVKITYMLPNFGGDESVADVYLMVAYFTSQT